MTTPQLTDAIKHWIEANCKRVAWSLESASFEISDEQYEGLARALLAQPAAAPPAPGGDVLRHLADWFAHRRYGLYDGEFVAREIRRAIAEDSAYLQSTQGQTPLQVWYGSMPESAWRAARAKE